MWQVVGPFLDRLRLMIVGVVKGGVEVGRGRRPDDRASGLDYGKPKTPRPLPCLLQCTCGHP